MSRVVLNARPDRSPRKALKQPTTLAPAGADAVPVGDEGSLAALCASLLPTPVSLSAPERALVEGARDRAANAALCQPVATAVTGGSDPLGEWLTAIRSPELRRAAGAVYTPQAILRPMIGWLQTQGTPDRVVDPGAGSGRFILAAADAFAQARLIAVENDPLAALVLRTNLYLRGLTHRAEIIVDDYRRLKLPATAGMTAFVGNPPYVRHHHIGARWKTWYTRNFDRLGIPASAMAGLHLHFFLKTALLARRGDVGAFVTSAEWLDVNYGAALRQLLLQRLGAVGLHILAPRVEVFSGTATTAAITCFRVADEPAPVKVRQVTELKDLADMDAGTTLSRAALGAVPRWSSAPHPVRSGSGDAVALGELFRVFRGQVTGANAVWIFGDDRPSLPQRVLLPAITRAQELIRAGSQLVSTAALRKVADLPHDLDGFDDDDRRRIDAYLAWARRNGAHDGYIARHRRAWWAVGLREPAPILCTYMARRAPQFTLNVAGARHINVAHGLYPRETMTDARLAGIVNWLNGNVDVASGRTYAWGLTKFEPKEVERLRVPAQLLSG